MAQATMPSQASIDLGRGGTVRGTSARNTTGGTSSPTRHRTTAAKPGTRTARKPVTKTVARNEVRKIRNTAKGQARVVARVAGDDVAGLVGSARNEAGRVGDEVAGQVRGLLTEARVKLQEQAETEARRAAGNLGNLGTQAVALATGRPEQAGPFVDYAQQAADWLESRAIAIEEKGADGVAADVADFASRRPVVFLVGAAALGVGVGRLIRASGLPPAPEPSRPASKKPVASKPRSSKPVASRPRSRAASSTPRSTRTTAKSEAR